MNILFLYLLCSGLHLPATTDAVTMAVNQTVAQSGSTVCVDITAANFKDLLSFQHSINWDPKVLEFEQVQGFGLPFLSTANFGTHKSNEGQLTVVWLDNSLRGVQLQDGNRLYQLCFRVKGAAGSSSAVSITDTPTPFEAVNKQEQVIDINPVNGGVMVR